MFLSEPTDDRAVAFLEKERAATGYVMNLERAWAWRPDIAEDFGALRGKLMNASSLTERETAILVCATASTRGDSYCSLAWGTRLARQSDALTAAAVLLGIEAEKLSPREAALRHWAGLVAHDPNGVRADHVDTLRAAGLGDREIFEATVFIALRMAFSAVNSALGARPDAELAAAAPPEVRAAVTYGRPAES